MVREFVIDSLKYWVEEYGVDGFRFDLMALLDTGTMREAEKELRRLKPDIVLYGEPWKAAASPVKHPADKHGIKGAGIGAFNDNFRNALKGPPNGGEPGWIQKGWEEDDVKQGITGTWRNWGDSPAQSINYMTCHDNLVLIDKLKLSMEGVGEAEMIRVMKLGYLALFTAQGVPFLHGGEEFARSKGGDHNSYESPDSVNQVAWALKKKNHALFRYVRDLIAMRRAHPLFRMRKKENIAKRLRFHDSHTHQQIAYTIDGEGIPGETWKKVFIALNSHDGPAEFTLPKGHWQFVLEEDGPSGRHAAKKIVVKGRSGVVLRKE
jgi:pullulanase